MRSLLLSKICLMVLILAVVVYGMTNINSESVNRMFAAFGVEPGTVESPGLQSAGRSMRAGETRLSLCRTRVHAIVWPNGHRVEESKSGMTLKWIAHDPAPRELAYLAVEKWFSQHCQILVSDLQSVEVSAMPDAFTDFLALKFIDGSSHQILRGGDGRFRLGEKSFRSDDLEAAVADLIKTTQMQLTQ